MFIFVVLAANTYAYNYISVFFSEKKTPSVQVEVEIKQDSNSSSVSLKEMLEKDKKDKKERDEKSGKNRLPPKPQLP